MFGRQVLSIAFFQGASVLLAVFVVYLWSILDGHDDGVVRSLTFATLVVGNLALILVNRSWHLSIVQSFKERKNTTLYWILGVATSCSCSSLPYPARARRSISARSIPQKF